MDEIFQLVNTFNAITDPLFERHHFSDKKTGKLPLTVRLSCRFQGTRFVPDYEVVALANFFHVSCEYLLGVKEEK